MALKLAPAGQNPALSEPRWDGQDLHGRTILLLYEQGLGDAIQFVRYAPLVSQRGGRAVIQCQGELVRLLRSNPDLGKVIPLGATPPPFDVQCPLVSLPFVFRTDLRTIPASVPYLHPEPGLIDSWRQQLALSSAGLNIGLAWAGNPLFREDRTRSIELRQLVPLGAVPGVSFYSFQKSSAADQAISPPPPMKLTPLGPELHDFADTAAALSLMDLVITTDTSIAHLAGALARPVWVMLQFVPDWRWLLDRNDTPWYPTMRLFRQTSLGDWPDVIDRVAKSLLAFPRSDRAISPVPDRARIS